MMGFWDTPPGEERPVSPTTLRALLALDALFERVNAMTLPTTDQLPVAGRCRQTSGAVGAASGYPLLSACKETTDDAA